MVATPINEDRAMLRRIVGRISLIRSMASGGMTGITSDRALGIIADECTAIRNSILIHLNEPR